MVIYGHVVVILYARKGSMGPDVVKEPTVILQYNNKTYNPIDNAAACMHTGAQ